jgi:hypothetical protein
MTHSHLIPESIGGFLWGWTQCAKCNSELGSDVEGAIKRDDSIRQAIEVALANELPVLAARFREGQPYAKRTEQGVVRAKVKGGSFKVASGRGEDESLIQSTERARSSIETMLRRQGQSPQEIEKLLSTFDDASEGALTPLTETLAIRHGSVEGFDLPFDGKPLSDAFPATIAFHYLALKFGRARSITTR